MEFFKKTDLDFFTSVQGKKYRSGNSDDEITGEKLAKGIYAKTDHWRWLIAEQGYKTAFAYHWQNSGNYRSYTWARVYPPGYEATQICFIFGIAAYDKQGNLNPHIFYRLDCKRTNGLAPYQIRLFDEYLEENTSDNTWRGIWPDDLQNYDWQKLRDLILDFIDEHYAHYFRLMDLVWPSGVGTGLKLARICWNDYNWQKPSGNNGKSDTSGKSHEKEKGYGYEEWLFDLDKQIDGYHYAFLQAFNKGKHEGQVYDVSVYTIYNDWETRQKKYFWVGRIYQLKVLTEEERKWALQQYVEKGWYEEMNRNLKTVGIDGFNFDYIDKANILNCRFEVANDTFEIYDPPRFIENPDQELGLNRHYVLLDFPSTGKLKRKRRGSYKFEEGHNPTKTGFATYTSVARQVKRSLEHKEIQEKVYYQFKKAFEGTASKVRTEQPTGFGTMIDVVVRHPGKRDIFYEVKTGYSALSCIREALGQILEYAMYPKHSHAKQMIIVAPHEPDRQVIDYLKHLRTSLGIELYYQQYSREKKRLLEALF